MRIRSTIRNSPLTHKRRLTFKITHNPDSGETPCFFYRGHPRYTPPHGTFPIGCGRLTTLRGMTTLRGRMTTLRGRAPTSAQPAVDEGTERDNGGGWTPRRVVAQPRSAAPAEPPTNQNRTPRRGRTPTATDRLRPDPTPPTDADATRLAAAAAARRCPLARY
jgi:hypothetical protein